MILFCWIHARKISYLDLPPLSDLNQGKSQLNKTVNTKLKGCTFHLLTLTAAAEPRKVMFKKHRGGGGGGVWTQGSTGGRKCRCIKTKTTVQAFLHSRIMFFFFFQTVKFHFCRADTVHTGGSGTGSHVLCKKSYLNKSSRPTHNVTAPFSLCWLAVNDNTNGLETSPADSYNKLFFLLHK